VKRAQGLVDLLCPFIGPAGPEEPLQSVSLAAGNDMDMKMRDALADAIIDGHEGSLGVHALHDGAGKKLDIQKERADELLGQIPERLKMALNDEQAMARKKRPVIQKCKRDIVLKNFVAGNAAADDIAESTVLFQLGNELHRGICVPAAGRASCGRKAAE